VSPEASLSITSLDDFIERGARDRLAEALRPGIEGAHAALETFYYAHNTASRDLYRRMGIAGSAAHLLDRTVRIHVELTNIARYATPALVIFAGIERGSYEHEGIETPLEARTTRVFGFIEGQGWRQVHHHGSIDDPAALAAYQSTMRSPRHD